MDNSEISICSVCNHLPSQCLGHTLLPHLQSGTAPHLGGGDGCVGTLHRVTSGSEAHKAAVILPRAAWAHWERIERHYSRHAT